MQTEAPARTAVRLEIDGNVGVIVVDNPPVNAGSWEVRSGLVAAVNDLARDPSLVAGVLIGAGTTFIAGSDLKEFDKPLRDPQVPAVIAAIEGCPKPIVAAIHGAGLGGGFEVALACDARVVTNDAVVGLPEVHLGVIPGAGGTQRVPRLVGVAKAIELIATGRRVPGIEATQLGLADAVADGDLRAFAVNFARQLAPRKRRVRDQTVRPDTPEALTRALEAARVLMKGNSAVKHAVELIQRAPGADIDANLVEERTLFQRLRTSDAAFAMRHLFFAERIAGRLRNRGVKPRAVKRIGIIGGGPTQIDIAKACIDAGYSVVVVERDRAVNNAANDRLQTDAMRKIEFVDGYASVADVDLVIDAAVDDAQGNSEAAMSGRPVDVVGMHFFTPADVTRVVEVMRTEHTSDQALATALHVVRSLGKSAVISTQGFIGDRIRSSYRRACEIALEEGAYPEQVDAALEAFGFSIGVFAAEDKSGLDIECSTRRRPAPGRDLRERHVSREFSAEQIQTRALAAIVNEAALVLEDGIAERASDIDLVLVHGYGFPAERGGPLFWASRLPRPELDQMIDAWAADIGVGFRRGDLDRALSDLVK